MINLNLTYEQSKKILELGYDLSEVCLVFAHKGGVSVYRTPVGGVYTDGIKFYNESILDGFIPIIPKAVLEKCLPEILTAEVPAKNLRRKKVDAFLTKNLVDDSIDLVHSDLYEEFIRQFDHILEAFLWCHGNYPEELRKKFDEVMKSL